MNDVQIIANFLQRIFSNEQEKFENHENNESSNTEISSSVLGFNIILTSWLILAFILYIIIYCLCIRPIWNASIVKLVPSVPEAKNIGPLIWLWILVRFLPTSR